MAKIKAEQKSLFTGLWHIVSMETWDENYFNEEVQAFIELEENGTGPSQPLNGPGMATTRWMRPKAGDGPC